MFKGYFLASSAVNNRCSIINRQITPMAYNLVMLWSFLKVVTMNDDMFNELLESVQQADNLIKGQVSAARITEFADPEVKAIRTKTGLSQSRFANLLGVSKRTLENWEQGRRHPTGPARALLKIVEADPEYALKTLHG